MTGIDEKAIEIATRYGGFDAGTTGHRWLAEAIAEALSALPAAPMPVVKATVKELVWEDGVNPDSNGNRYWRAQTTFDWGYRVYFEDNRYVWRGENSDFSTLADAQSAIEADYSTRILSALDVPAHPEGVKDDVLTALVNLAREMRFMLRQNPKMDGGLYRQRLDEADAAIASANRCPHNCDEGGMCLAEHSGFPQSCPSKPQKT